MKDTLKSRFLCEIPLPSLNLESNIFIRRTCLEFYNAIVGALSWLQIVLWSFLFIKELWIENIELIPLNSFWGRIVIIIVLTIVFVPLNCDSSSIYILWFFVSKSSFSLTWNPVIKLLLIFFQTFVLLKFDNLLSDEIDCNS